MKVTCTNCGEAAILMTGLIICASCRKAMTELDALGYLREKDWKAYYDMTVNERLSKVYAICAEVE